jgi:hypothetical protein
MKFLKSALLGALLLAGCVSYLSAQGEFLPRGKSGAGVSFGGAFNSSANATNIQAGGSYKGLIDLGAVVVYTKSNEGNGSVTQAGPAVAFHLSKQSDTSADFESAVGFLALLGQNHAIVFQFMTMKDLTPRETWMLQPQFGISWTSIEGGGHGGLSIGLVTGVKNKVGTATALTMSLGYMGGAQDFSSGISYGTGLALVY